MIIWIVKTIFGVGEVFKPEEFLSRYSTLLEKLCLKVPVYSLNPINFKNFTNLISLFFRRSSWRTSARRRRAGRGT